MADHATLHAANENHGPRIDVWPCTPMSVMLMLSGEWMRLAFAVGANLDRHVEHDRGSN